MTKLLPLVLFCLVALPVQSFSPSPRKNHVGASSSRAMSSNPFDSLLGGVFGKQRQGTKEEVEPTLPDVVIDPDFRLAGIFLTAGLILDSIPYIQLVLGPLVTVLGVLFLVQTFRIRFVFDSTSFELKQGDSLEDTGENVVVGGANRWTYDSFVNVSVSVI